ncbi:MAG TPA: antibiotic biosynthesis monooxygenase [Gemmatimonadaceae bacterium]|jgi:quinol monooxygenase YgiN|nr:antibiotic biosynthesis monooxygenase [Gemmatimonadaceae bacterium]
MLIVHVHVHVNPDAVDAFIAATRENARNSAREAGVVRFDVVQQDDDPTRFALIEIYRTAADPARHKETAHYATWRDTVAPMMAEPRTSVKYHAIAPEPSAWEYPR